MSKSNVKLVQGLPLMKERISREEFLFFDFCLHKRSQWKDEGDNNIALTLQYQVFVSSFRLHFRVSHCLHTALNRKKITAFHDRQALLNCPEFLPVLSYSAASRLRLMQREILENASPNNILPYPSLWFSFRDATTLLCLYSLFVVTWQEMPLLLLHTLSSLPSDRQRTEQGV